MSFSSTQMLHEIREIPSVVARQLAEGMPLYREEGLRLRREKPRFLVTCARGTSDHAATFLKYLVETRIGIPVASVGPSVASLYRSRLQYAGGVCVAVSQSGGSPDLASLQDAARTGGARTLALLNVSNSLVGASADTVLPLLAGQEQAVAATKSFVASLVALTGIVAAWSDDKALGEAIARLPDALSESLLMDWRAALLPVAAAQSLFTIARGPGLSVAGEAALKLKETCRLHAEAYSAAEVRHGPIALARDRLAIIAFNSPDEGERSITEAANALEAAGASVFMVGHGDVAKKTLPSPETGHPLINLICQITSFYRFVEQLSVGLGENPDSPTLLRKVTQTI